MRCVPTSALRGGGARGSAGGGRLTAVTAVTAFCEAAGIALDDARRTWIDGANAAQLDARLGDLRATRAWA